MGARIQGAGGPTIRIEGVDRLQRRRAHGDPRPHRDRAPSWPPAPSRAATSRSATATRRTCARCIDKLRETGVRIEEGPDNLRVRAPRTLKAVQRHHPAPSRLPHRHAGPVHGAHDPGRRAPAPSRSRSSRTATCTWPSCSAWARTSASTGARPSSPGHTPLSGAAGHGHRPARLRLPGPGRPGRQRARRWSTASTTSTAATTASTRSCAASAPTSSASTAASTPAARHRPPSRSRMTGATAR